jgi:DNA-binding winged helix-turn-helix (wHTH) protein
MATTAMRDLSATSMAFGPFRVFPTRRLVTEHDKPIRIGSRAFDILLALLERPGELVTKEDLIARAWPDTFVEATNLAVQVGGLRRALGDGIGHARYVINVPGRGYRFVAPVTVETGLASVGPATAVRRVHELPVQASRALGADGFDELTQKLEEEGVHTVTRGSSGSPAVALAIIVKLLGGDRSGLWLLDLRRSGES